MEPLTGRHIGPYILTEWMGEGGMAVVYKAHQPSLHRDVAVKLLTGALARDHELVERFRREAVAAGALGHPNILTIYDAGTTDDGLHYIVMEYAPGGTLKKMMANGPMPPDQVCDLAAQIAGALQAAHDHGIIHRDLKPSNILLARDGRPLLMDFGVALTAAESRLTRTGIAVGTPEYMSPEQAQGTAIDSRSDLYSLGILMYEMLSGDVPFLGDTPLTTLYQQVHQPVATDRLADQGVPAWLISVVQKALSKRPDDRFDSASQMSAALGCAIPATPDAPPLPAVEKRTTPAAVPVLTPEAEPPTEVQPLPPLKPPRKRRRVWRWVLLFGAVISAFVCLGLWLVYQELQEYGFTVDDPTVWTSVSPGSSAQETATSVAEATSQAAVTGTAQAHEVALAATSDARATDAVDAAEAAISAFTESDVSVELYDDFTMEDVRWSTGYSDSENLEGSRFIADGFYTWEATAKKNVRWWSRAGVGDQEDYVVALRGRQSWGPDTASYGLIFRDTGSGDHYLFRVRESGHYQVAKVQDDQWTHLTDWVYSAAIRQDDYNDLWVIAQGADFVIGINEEMVDMVTDDTYASGDVGLVIGLLTAGDSAGFEFDAFEFVLQ